MRKRIVFTGILLLSVLLNLLSWMSAGFSDFYVENIFPKVTAPLAHFSALLPFSLGECMLIAAVLWLLVLVLLLLFRAAVRRPFRRATAWLVNLVFLVMTLNCVILYHVTPIEESLSGKGKTYSVEELSELRDYVVERCNVLSGEVPRGEDGEVCYDGGDAAMAQEARIAVAGEAQEYPWLSGWSTIPKGMFASDFISQQYMQGYYFPFSMEANYNTVMKIMNKPFTMCHELAHTHGYIYEDEANLLGFLACIHSENPVFQYSGWLGVLNYVDNAFYRNVSGAVYREHPAVSKTVRSDNEFLSDEAWEKVERDAVFSTETVKAAADTYLDTTLKANGIRDGKASYERVVGLLLEYFDGDFPDFPKKTAGSQDTANVVG